jgi:ABC-type branched-subunit amino acid transport system ATPase component
MFEVDRLCVSYAQSQVVNEVSFAAAQNEAVALMGRNGIQPSIIKDIANALNEIRKLRQITLIVSEQVLSFALADRILVLERGRIIHADHRADAGVARITG